MCACLPNDLDQLRDPWRCSNRNMRRAQHHRPNIGRCASCRIGHFPRSSTRLCTRRITSSQRSRCKSHRHMEQSHAQFACPLQLNTANLPVPTSTLFSLLAQQLLPVSTSFLHGNINAIMANQNTMTKSHCYDSNHGVQCYARPLVPLIASKCKPCKTQAHVHWTTLNCKHAHLPSSLQPPTGFSTIN